jgi:hypothetical protein
MQQVTEPEASTRLEVIETNRVDEVSGGQLFNGRAFAETMESWTSDHPAGGIGEAVASLGAATYHGFTRK